MGDNVCWYCCRPLARDEQCPTCARSERPELTDLLDNGTRCPNCDGTHWSGHDC